MSNRARNAVRYIAWGVTPASIDDYVHAAELLDYEPGCEREAEELRAAAALVEEAQAIAERVRVILDARPM